MAVQIAQQATTAQASTKDQFLANQVPSRQVLVKILSVTLVLMESSTLYLDRLVAQSVHQAILALNQVT